MTIEPVFPLVGIGTGVLALVLWVVLLVRVLLRRHAGQGEQRVVVGHAGDDFVRIDAFAGIQRDADGFRQGC